MVSDKQVDAALVAWFEGDENWHLGMTPELKSRLIGDMRDALTAAELSSDTQVAYKVVRKKFYVSEWGSSKLLEARNGGLVTDEGEAWLYEYTAKDGTGGSYDMLFRRVYTNPIPSEPAPAAEPFKSCPDCAGSGYSNHPDSGQVCYRCNGQGSYTHPTPSEARLREALLSIANNMCCEGCQEAALVARAALKEANDERS